MVESTAKRTAGHEATEGPSPSDGCQAQPQQAHQQKQVAKPEVPHRNADQPGDLAGPIDPSVMVDGAYNAYWNADQHRNDRRRQRKFERIRHLCECQ